MAKKTERTRLLDTKKEFFRYFRSSLIMLSESISVAVAEKLGIDIDEDKVDEIQEVVSDVITDGYGDVLKCILGEYAAMIVSGEIEPGTSMAYRPKATGEELEEMREELLKQIDYVENMFELDDIDEEDLNRKYNEED